MQISLPDIVVLRGLQMGTRGFQGVSSLCTQLSPVSNWKKAVINVYVRLDLLGG